MFRSYKWNLWSAFHIKPFNIDCIQVEVTMCCASSPYDGALCSPCRPREPNEPARTDQNTANVMPFERSSQQHKCYEQKICIFAPGFSLRSLMWFYFGASASTRGALLMARAPLPRGSMHSSCSSVRRAVWFKFRQIN